MAINYNNILFLHEAESGQSKLEEQAIHHVPGLPFADKVVAGLQLIALGHQRVGQPDEPVRLTTQTTSLPELHHRL